MELIGFHSQIDTAIYKVLFSNVRVYTFIFALVMVRQEMKDPKDQEKKKKTTSNQQARTSANPSVFLVREGRNVIRVQNTKVTNGRIKVYLCKGKWHNVIMHF